MSDDRTPTEPRSAAPEDRLGLDALADEVLPALVARLRASRLGELEVGGDGWRVRLRRATQSARQPATRSAPTDDGGAATEISDGNVARSPAVGYFQPAVELAVGSAIRVGDRLGSVDVLGIVQDVNAPADGIVSSILAEDGQAVEYGQALAGIELLPAEVDDHDRATS